LLSLEAYKAHKVFRVSKAIRATSEKLAHRVSKVFKESRATKVTKATLVTQGLKVQSV
jgi:hypothetical protein